ncbi:MAG: YncE family protein, partial [Candidatus Acidiferrales bacterium]
MLDKNKTILLLLFVAAVNNLYPAAQRPAAAVPSAGKARIAARSAAPQANSESSTDDGGAARVQLSLDYQTYRGHIEPIFLKMRQGGVRCYDCHSKLATRLRLEPLSPESSTWTEDQSRRNFETVSQLVTPSDPLRSPLLIHPLAQEAGGDPTHTGGKFWASQNDPEWQTLADWVRNTSPGSAASHATSRSAASDPLDFDFFKTRVELILLKERPGHARCYGCHAEANRVFHLERLSPGSANWTDEQSQRNFQSALQQVVPGDPTSSRLLMHPLAPEAGGEPFHSGGRQFQSQNDPDWLTVAAWVRGSKAGTASGALPAPMARIFITNSAGDTVDVIDPVTNKVVQVIGGVELPHGVNFSPDGTRVYISNESESVLDVVDRKSGEIVQKIPLSGHPNNIAIS